MGWYPDPTQANQERYWDGQGWTRNVRDPQPDEAWRSGLGASAPAHSPAEMLPAQAVAKPKPATADGVVLASFWWRVGARLIDSLLAQAISLPLAWPWLRQVYREMQVVMGQAMAGKRHDQQAFAEAIQHPMLMATLVQVAVFAAFTIIPLGLFGRTVGKWALGLRLVPVDEGQARRPSWRSVLVRQLAITVFSLLDQFISVMSLINALHYFSGTRRQTLADRFARTQVVRDRQTARV